MENKRWARIVTRIENKPDDFDEFFDSIETPKIVLKDAYFSDIKKGDYFTLIEPDTFKAVCEPKTGRMYALALSDAYEKDGIQSIEAKYVSNEEAYKY